MKKDLIHTFVGMSAGFSLFLLASHPRSKVHKKMPVLKLKNVSLVPHVKVSRKDKHYHLHHWINISALYLVLLATKRKALKEHKAFHGFLLGSILQGLLYQDRFSIVSQMPQELHDK